LVLAFSILTAIALSGCTPKPQTTTPTGQTGTTPGATGATGSATAQLGTGTTQTAADQSQLEETFKKNYETAKQIANSPLKNQAQFCSALIEFGSENIAQANQYFFFTSPEEKLKDWYWIVYFDQIRGERKRFFAVRKDYEGEIACITTKQLPTTTYFSAYTTFLAAGTTGQNASLAVRTTIGLQESSWKIDLVDSGGQIIASQQVDATSSAPTASPATPGNILNQSL